jgi:beta-lactamase class D
MHPLWKAIKERDKAKKSKCHPLFLKKFEDKVNEEAYKVMKILNYNNEPISDISEISWIKDSIKNLR